MDTFYLVSSIILSILNGVIVIYMSYKFLHTYQLNNYHVGRLFNWFKNTNGTYFKRLLLISLLSLAGLIVTNILFAEYVFGLLGFLGLVFYFIISIVFVKYESKIPKKKPLALTWRMKRQYTLITLIAIFGTFGLFHLNYSFLEIGGVIGTLRFVFIAITPLFVPIIVFITALITSPFENLNNRRYIKKAEKTLAMRNDLIKIGITGSYAKTTVKSILTTILSEKYKVLATPMSYNTPLGITKSVGRIKPEHEVFIAEMGARNVGNIRELCNMVEPEFGIITGISNQHLESFLNISNIIKTKCELSDCVAKNSGITYVNGDTKRLGELLKKVKGEYVVCGLSDSSYSVYAQNISVSKEGSKFDLVIEGKSIPCSTKMLGKHNISNIVVCAGLAHKLGVENEKIANAISKLEPPSHRLNLIETPNGMCILDDTFNANAEGAKAALEILSMFDARKVIVTPGLVELGVEERKTNKEFGKQIATTCDVAVLIGLKRSEPIREGLLEKGFKEENILVFNSLSEAKGNFKNFLKSTDAVLLENDLPDDYNEVRILK